METVEYAAGRLADIFGGPTQPTVLLWHGQQPDARSSVRPLAELIAAHGLGVIAPDWDSYAHDGGRADLLALDTEEGVAYLRLSGGCQGCAMSQMTLKQGIETTLLEEVAELKRVVDVTDHGGGENPFYS